MAEIVENNIRRIFTESIHGASVGVRNEDKEIVHVKFSDYKLPSKAEEFTINHRGREVANLDMFKDVETDVSLILRVYLLEGELLEDYKIFAYKNDAWVDMVVDEKPEVHGKWVGYLEVEMNVGDPPIAVGR